MLIFLVISLLIAVLAVVFALQNASTVTITFLAWNIRGSLALVLLLTTIAGILVGFFAALPTIIRDKWKVRSQRKRATELEASLTVHKKKLEEVQNRLTELEQPSKPAELPPQPPVFPTDPEGSKPA